MLVFESQPLYQGSRIQTCLDLRLTQLTFKLFFCLVRLQLHMLS